jgi:hypothetical protein
MNYPISRILFAFAEALREKYFLAQRGAGNNNITSE